MSILYKKALNIYKSKYIIVLNIRHYKIYTFVIIFILTINLIIPSGGYVGIGGQSMDPIIPMGCGIIATDSWDGESSLKGEVVAYNIEYEKPESITVMNYEINSTITWYGHTVVEEYKNYNMSTANHYVKEDDILEDDILVNESGEQVRLRTTEQSHESVKELEGKHVLILKGENNNQIDNEIVPVENVHSILDVDNQLQIQSLDSWPCSIFNPE